MHDYSANFNKIIVEHTVHEYVDLQGKDWIKAYTLGYYYKQL